MDYTAEQTTHWLSWLAWQMKQQNQTIFYLEHLQPNWLINLRERILYQLSVVLLTGLVSGLVGGLVGGPVVGLLGGLLLLGALSWGVHSVEPSGSSTPGSTRLGPVNGLVVGLVSGLVVGLVVGLLAGLLSRAQIQLSEVLTWSWRVARRNIARGLLLGLVVGLAEVVLFGLVSGLDDAALSLGLLSGLVVLLTLGLLGGLSANQLDERLRLAPNQGIWRSAQNGLVSGLLGVLVCGLPGGLGSGLFGLLGGLLLGLLGGLALGLFGGVNAFLQHFTLRFWLWRAKRIPWNYPCFLDSAAERILLRKVGGGYIFVHRLLLEYFASLDTTPMPDTARAKKEQAGPVS